MSDILKNIAKAAAENPQKVKSLSQCKSCYSIFLSHYFLEVNKSTIECVHVTSSNSQFQN